MYEVYIIHIHKYSNGIHIGNRSDQQRTLLLTSTANVLLITDVYVKSKQTQWPSNNITLIIEVFAFNGI